MNAAISETEIDTTVNPICLAPSRSPAEANGPFEIAEHVFDHHDCIVDHEADLDRERHQRQIVDGETGRPHGCAGAGER